ncbi:MAG: hypothetical protein ACKVQU_10110 [Burkholderiales bacterium]
MASTSGITNASARAKVATGLKVVRSFTLGALIVGCTTLLPRSANVTEVTWATFEDAQAAIESLTPFETHKVALTGAGLEPYANPAITLLTYSDIVQRFAAGSAIRSEDLDPGIRECLIRGRACIGYAVNAKHMHRERTGNFFLDALNFRRETEVTGWSFNAVVLLVDDVVVYRRFGGQPRIRERETTQNPLGPLQGWGESVGSAFAK